MGRLKYLVIPLGFILVHSAWAVSIARIAATDTEIIISLSNVEAAAVRIYERELYESFDPQADPVWEGDGLEARLPRYVGAEDRLYRAFQLTDAESGALLGEAQHVTDLSGLERRMDDAQGWIVGGQGCAVSADDGSLLVTYAHGSPFDPYISNSTSIDADVAPYFVFRVRMTSPIQPVVPCAIYSFGGASHGRQPFSLNATGEWQTVAVDLRDGEGEAWTGTRMVRLDLLETVATATDYLNASTEIDWIAMAGSAGFDGSDPAQAEAYWDFTSDRNFEFPNPESIKGLQVQMVDDAITLGVKHAGVNILVNAVIDISETSGETWEVDGHTYHINTSYVSGVDSQIAPLSAAGMRVSLILLNAVPTSAQPGNPFIHPETDLANAPNHLGAFNLTNAEGLRAYRAAMEYLAHHYSDPGASSGWVANYIVGNEVNSHWWWYNMGAKAIGPFMEQYEQAVRVTDLAVRQFHAGARAFISLEHHWTTPFQSDPLRSARGKDIMDHMSANAHAQGDYPWQVAFHPYPENLFDPEFWNDTTAPHTLAAPRITFKNIEILPVYMQQESFLFENAPRSVILSEQGFHTPSSANGQTIQAAAYAYAYHRIRHTPSIDAFILHRHVDHRLEGGLLLGLWTYNPGAAAPSEPLAKKASWEVFRLADTDQWESAFAFALPVVGLNNWDEGLPARARIDFTFTDGMEGWEGAGGVTDVAVADGALTASTLSVTPAFERDNMFLLGSVTGRVYIRMSATSGSGGRLWWETVNSPGYSEANSRSFALVGDGAMAIHEVDLSAEAGWQGEEIRGLRLTPTNVPMADVAVDFVLAPMPGGDLDGDGVTDGLEFDGDTDEDGWPDVLDTDSDDDGIGDGEEGTADLDGDGLPNLRDLDSDGDGMPDAYEHDTGLDPYADDADDDADNDTFSNADEYAYGTDPFDPDSFPGPSDLGVSSNLINLTEAAPSSEVNVFNQGDLPLSWSAASDSEGVQAAPAGGTGPGAVTISATDFSQDITANVTVSNDENAADFETVVVQVAHTPLPGDVAVSTNALTLSADQPSAVFNVINVGDLALQWTITSDNAAVTVDPASGQDGAEVTVSAADFSQDQQAVLTVANDADALDTETVVVTLVRTPDPSDLAVSTNQIALTEEQPSSAFNVLNAGEAPLSWAVESDTPEVTVSPEDGAGAGSVTVTGTDFTQDRTANVTVRNTADTLDTETVVVSITRTPLPGDLAVSTNAITLTQDAPEASLNIINTGELPLDWTATSDDATVTLDAATGTDTTQVTIQATDFSQDRNVTITIQNDAVAEDREIVVVTVVAAPGGISCAGGREHGTHYGDLLLILVSLAALAINRINRDTSLLSGALRRRDSLMRKDG